jgi:PAS domain S-box-containing protein
METKKLRFRFKDLSKKYQLVLTITLLLFLLSASFYMIFPKIIGKALVEEFQESQKTIVSLTAENLWSLIFFESEDKLEFASAVAPITKLENFTHIYVYDKEGYLIYSYVNDKIPNEIQTYRPDKSQADYMNSDLQLYIANKNIETEDEVIGKVSLICSADIIMARIETIKIRILIVCAICLALGTVFSFFIAKLISTPLEILLKTFNKISTGNLSERVDISTNEEFGQLAKTFNQMVDNLEESYFELSEINKNMEAKVEERTEQLQNQIEVRAKAEENLKSTNQIVTSIINTSPVPIIALTTDYKVKSASPAVKSIFFYEEFEILDKIIPIIYANELDEFIAKINAKLVPNHNEKFQIKGRKKNGQFLDLQIVSAAVFNDNDEHQGYILIVDDITERLLSEKALRESEAKYRSLIEDSIVGIGIIKDRGFTFVNHALLRIWKFPTAGEFLSIAFTEVIQMEDRTKIVELFERSEMSYIKQNSVFEPLEIRIICYDGEEKYVELAPNVLNVDDEYYLQITFVDITARKTAENQIKAINEELEQRVVERTAQLNKTLVDLRNEINERVKLSKELQFKSEVLDSTTSICIVWNSDGEIAYVSPWTLHVLEIPQEMVLGGNIWNIPNFQEVILIKEFEFTKKNMIAMARGETELYVEPYTLEIRPNDSKKAAKYLQLNISKGLNNTLISAGADITDQINSKKELENLSEQLTKSLESEKELNDLKTRFISMVSHEFRTPLTVIMSCATIIQQAIENNRIDLAEQYLDKINKSVKTMSGLMEDVLTIGKAESGSESGKIEDIVEIDFVDFVKNSLEEIQEAYDFKSKANLSIEGKIHNIESSEKMLKHIVSNLITNALKYTTNGEDVNISIKEDGENVIFKVADRGIGIPEEDMKHLFSNFHRAKNVGKIAGTGLGLHIVKRNIDNLAGTIEVESTENVGTTFTVKIPIHYDFDKK